MQVKIPSDVLFRAGAGRVLAVICKSEESRQYSFHTQYAYEQGDRHIMAFSRAFTSASVSDMMLPPISVQAKEAHHDGMRNRS